MATSRLDILINAKNLASAGIAKINKSLKDLNASISPLNKALGGLGIALGTQQFVQFTIGAAQAAGQAERVEESFRQLAGSVGGSADEMMDAMRQMSAGMIGDTELMLSANKAMMLGVADSADEMSRLLEVAAERGQAMGLTTAQAFNDIVTGIGRQSAMILDNLGIVVDVESAYEDYATVLGKTADELTDVEKKQAFLNQVLTESDGALDAKIDEFQRLTVALQDLRIEFGKVAAVPLANLAEGTTDTIALNRQQQEIKSLIDSWDFLTDAQREYYTQSLKDIAFNTMNLSIEQQMEALQGLRDLMYNVSQSQLGVMPESAFPVPDFGEWNPDVIRGNIQSALDSATGGGQFMINLPSGSVTLNTDYLSEEELAGIAETTGRETGQLWSAAFNESIEAGVSYESAIGNADALLRNAQQQIAQLTSSLADADTPAWQIEEAISALVDSMIDAVRTTGDLSSAGGQAGQAVKGSMIEAASGVRILTYELGTAIANLGNLGSALTTAKSAFGAFLDDGGKGGKLSVLNDGLAEAGEIGYSLERIYSPSGSIATGLDRISGIAGKVSSLLNFGDTAGIDADDLLPRQDAIDENARRLADIAVNGFKGQDWLGEFAAEAPNIFQQLQESGDPQGLAAQLLKDFQDGLLNGTDELVDRDAAKERVKRMILGEQNTAAIANEIAQEVANEMGVAMQSAQAAAGAVLGGGGGEGEGGSSAVVDALKAQETQVVDAGKRVGEKYGTALLGAFESNVPGQLIQILALAVTPAVLAATQSERSRTSAAGATP